MRKGLILGVILTMVAAQEAPACSGPGAWKTILRNELIGRGLLVLSGAIAYGAFVYLRGLPAKRGRRWWSVVALAIHPGYWMSAVRGDCGIMLVGSSLIATAVIAGIAILAIALPVRNWYRFRLRTLLLLPIVVAILFSWLFSTHAYKAQVAIPHTFVIVDRATQRPIPGASVQAIHPDVEVGLQPTPIITGSNGHAWMMLSASEWGREGPLSSTIEGFRFGPDWIKVDAPGYRPFMAPSAEIIPGSKYPPTASVTIPLEPVGKAKAPSVAN